MVALRYLVTGVLSTVVSARYSNDTSGVSSSIASTISLSSSLWSESSSLSQVSSSDIPVLPSSSSIDYSSVTDNSTTSDVSPVTSSEILSHTSSLNSSSVTFTSTSTSDISTSTPSAAIENVQVFDTLSQSQISSNPNNWFVINVDISVTAGFTGDLFLTVPDQFSNFPEGIYDVLANEEVIGSVSHNSSGVFKVNFEDVAEDHYGSFNFLTKLADKPSEPTTVDYSFEVYSGPTFSSTLTFETKSYTVSTIDTGIDEFGRPYFAVDIPYNEYSGELEFMSAAESDYEFVASYFQIVTAVDSFKNPTAASNVTAAKSNSDESTISYSFSSSVSGGQALRIIYFLSADAGTTTLKNVAQLSYPNLSVYKRDISIIFETTAYLEPVSNIELSGINSITVLTSNVDNNNSTSTSIPTSTITSTNITSSMPTVTSVSTYSNESLTYTVITRTQDGEVTEITQLVPVSTLSSSSTSSASSENTTSTEITSSASSDSSHSKSLTSSSASSKETSSTLSKDSGSKSLTSTSTEEATSSRSKDSQSTSLTSSFAPIEETSSSKSRDTSSKSTSNSSEDVPLSYATVVTETVHGRTSTYTSWVSSCTACQKTDTLQTTSHTETAIRTDTPSSETTNLQTFTSLESRTLSGEETEIGSFVPVTTLATDVGDAAEKTQTSLRTSTRGAEVSTLLQFLGASTSSAEQTQAVVSQYSGFANRVEFGFRSLFIAILAIII
ncbi:Egt2 [Kluyveromyces lactis]|nr:Egt2 [Kluyveromyces lactis]